MPIAHDPVAAADVREREALILGSPQRIAALPRAEAGDAALAQAAKLRNATAAAADAKSLDDVPEIIFALLRHPELYDRFSGLSMELVGRGLLPARDRELVILRVAWLWQAPFPWGEHVAVAKLAGLTSAEIDRVTQGSSAEGWTPQERALLRATEELCGDGMIADATWAVLAERYDAPQLIELPILVGQFTTVSFTQNALRARLRDNNPGLAAR